MFKSNIELTNLRIPKAALKNECTSQMAAPVTAAMKTPTIQTIIQVPTLRAPTIPPPPIPVCEPDYDQPEFCNISLTNASKSASSRTLTEAVNNRNTANAESTIKNTTNNPTIKNNEKSSTSSGSSNLKPIENRFTNGLAIAWLNLSFYQPYLFWGSKTPILSQLKGQVNFGTLTALMGPSGAGKSTLLKCINGIDRAYNSSQTRFFVSKFEPIRPAFIVQDQKEHLLMNLTVTESLLYSSWLKNRSARSFNHSENIRKLLVDLLLVDCAKNKVSRCSGGEQKRLSIGLELTEGIKPNLICLDEPTSGLDSNAAEMTIKCLQSLARKHKLAIVTVIHQPNADVLLMYDQLYILAKGGRCVYSGPPNFLRQHLAECQIPCYDYQQPIEVLLKVASKKKKDILENLGIEAIDLGPPDDVLNLMTRTYENQKTLDNRCLTSGRLLTGPLRTQHKKFHPIDFYYLFCRCVHTSWLRGWMLQLGQFIVMMIGMSVSLWLFKDEIGFDAACFPTGPTNITDMRDNETEAEANVKYIFFTCIFFFYIHMVASVFVFSTEIRIFLNEHHNGWYSTSSYYYAKSICELPIIAIIAYLFVWLGYGVTNQPDMVDWYDGVWDLPERFGLYMLFFYMGLFNVQGLAIAMGICFPKNFKLSLIGATFILFISMFVAGFFSPSKNMSDAVKDMTDIASFIKGTFNSLLIVTYGRGRCENGSIILTRMNIDEDDLWEYFGWLSGTGVLWRVLGQIVLTFQVNPDYWLKIKGLFAQAKVSEI